MTEAVPQREADFPGLIHAFWNCVMELERATSYADAKHRLTGYDHECKKYYDLVVKSPQGRAALVWMRDLYAKHNQWRDLPGEEQT